MSIKSFETRESLKEKLKIRNLLFEDKELEKVLITHNYFNFFNGLETIFLESSSPKAYNKIKLQDFTNLYLFDKEIRSILSTCLTPLKRRLKILHFISLLHIAAITAGINGITEILVFIKISFSVP